MKHLVYLPVLALPLLVAAPAPAQQPNEKNIFSATSGEIAAGTPEVSTEELRTLVASGSILLIDTRPRLEWASGHIPGAVSVAPKPGLHASEHTADVTEIGRLIDGDRGKQIVLYCNGPFCGKSKRLARELLGAGYRNVRRYQLGAPVWRALGGVMAITAERVQHIYDKDKTAVWIDARDPAAFNTATLGGARNIPASKITPGKNVGEVRAAKNDGRLPMTDHNTRIIVFGSDAAEARFVAEALAREAFHNVHYFQGDYHTLSDAVHRRP